MDGNRFSSAESASHFRFLPHIEYLNVSNNMYAGKIAKELKYCKNLTHYAESGNLKAGELPSEFGVLTKLETLDVSHNPMITGRIPSEYGLLTNLNFFDIYNTSISGKIPEGLCLPGIEIVANCSAVQCCQ